MTSVSLLNQIAVDLKIILNSVEKKLNEFILPGTKSNCLKEIMQTYQCNAISAQIPEMVNAQ